MIEFLTASANFPFLASLCLMMLIAVLEAVGMLFGMGISSLIDNFFPDIDVDVPEVTAPSPLTALFDWLLIGQVPILILIVIFLTFFGLAGFFIQFFWMKITGTLLPSYVASIPAFIASFPFVRFLGKAVSNIMPTEETSAVSEETFVGKVAIITLGTARRDNPAQARLHDEYGQTHYVMVEPDSKGEEFETGDTVLIIEKSGSIFLAQRWIQ
jgi:hypothetical protein